jgi:hypothetical protein
MAINGTKKTIGTDPLSAPQKNLEKESTINSLEEECINLANESVRSTSGQELLDNE